MTRTSFTKALPVGLVILAAAAFSVPGVQAKSTARVSGGKGVAHSNGKPVKAGPVPTAQTYALNHHALEPTIDADKKGTLFYAAAGFEQARGALAITDVMRSKDGGKTWDVASPRVLDQNSMPVSLDPYVIVDEDTGRVFTIDLTVACSYLSFSDDQGDSWITNPLACGRPVNDHQTLFYGPPATSPTVGYENVLYYCWNDVASSACSKSLDGGVSFHPTGTPAYGGYEPGSEDPGFYGQDGFCGGLHGHGFVGADGSVFLPRELCGKPMVAISRDEGLTWDVIQVSSKRSISQPREGAGHPSVVADAKGNVYYTWVAADDRQVYLSVSRDNGETWGRPILVSPPGLKEANLPQIDVGDPGKVAIVYYGSSNSPFPKCKDECDPGDYAKTTWNGYVTITDTALDKDPVFFTGLVNKPSDPLVLQTCGPGRCKSVFDFIDVVIASDGIAYGAFVDDCMDDCKDGMPGEEYEGLVTKLVGGPPLR
jgi:hypothetical protein